MCDDDNSELNGACTAAQFCRCKGGFGGPKCAKGKLIYSSLFIR